MKTYIDRALIIPALTDRYEPEDARYQMTLTLAHIAEALLNIPTADVTEIVRCKDCQYYQDAKTNKKGFLICPASRMEITETDYCSYGAHMVQEVEHEAG